MKKILLVLAMTISCLATSAQVNRVGKVEGGFYVPITRPLGSFHNGSPKTGGGFGLDIRFNIKNSPWDYGAFLELGTAMRDFINSGGDYYQNNRTTVFGIASHYNFKQGARVNPYAGLGMGIALNDVVGLELYPSRHFSLAVSPRIGVELMRHVRVGCQTQITRKGFHNISLVVGIALGGGKKK